MSANNTKQPEKKIHQFRKARINKVFDKIDIIVGSEETVFEEVYVTGILPNNRVVRFKKSALEFM